jgi:hypothetical protein
MRVLARPVIERFQVIDSAVRRRVWPNAQTLARKLEVAARTIQRDIAFMRDRLNAPRQNDAIQLCAQGLLVEEAFGVKVESGVLYYMGSKSRIDVPLDATLRNATLAAIDRIRDLSSRETPPEPLPPELRHRCFGCSLATICLPEETLYSIQHSGVEPSPEPAVESEQHPGVMLTRVIP